MKNQNSLLEEVKKSQNENKWKIKTTDEIVKLKKEVNVLSKAVKMLLEINERRS